jgi:DNA-damage-inducible protein J
MMATIQMRIDDDLKAQVAALYASLGLDISTAIRMLFMTSLERNGLPFEVSHSSISAESLEAMEDVRQNRNLYGPYASAKEAVKAMLEG